MSEAPTQDIPRSSESQDSLPPVHVRIARWVIRNPERALGIASIVVGTVTSAAAAMNIKKQSEDLARIREILEQRHG